LLATSSYSSPHPYRKHTACLTSVALSRVRPPGDAAVDGTGAYWQNLDARGGVAVCCGPNGTGDSAGEQELSICTLAQAFVNFSRKKSVVFRWAGIS
jgi:hypothetical protein